MIVCILGTFIYSSFMSKLLVRVSYDKAMVKLEYHGVVWSKFDYRKCIFHSCISYHEGLMHYEAQ